MLPKTFFEELAERVPIVIFRNQLYQIAEDETTEDKKDYNQTKETILESLEQRLGLDLCIRNTDELKTRDDYNFFLKNLENELVTALDDCESKKFRDEVAKYGGRKGAVMKILKEEKIKVEGDSLSIESQRFSLVKADTLLNLENFYRYKHADALFELKKAHIQSKANEEIRSNKAIYELVLGYGVLCFILDEVFPYFRSSKDEIVRMVEGKEEKEKRRGLISGIENILANVSKKKMRAKAQAVSYEGVENILGDEFEEIEALMERIQEKQKQERNKLKDKKDEENLSDSFIESTVNRIAFNEINAFKEIIKRRDEQSKVSAPRTLLSVSLDDHDILTFNDQVYMFDSGEKKSDIRIVIDGQEYSLISFTNVRDVDEGYRKKLEKQLKAEAENEFDYQHEIKKNIAVLVKELGDIAKKEEYEEGQVGFIWKKDDLEKREGEEGKKRRGDYWVTFRINPYKLKDKKNERGGTYQFEEEVRVAVRVYYDNGKFRYAGNRVVVVDKYEHPFMTSSLGGIEWGPICRGENYLPPAHILKLDIAAQIAYVLTDAKRVLQRGHTKTSRDSIALNKLYHRRISPDDERWNTLPTTNE